MSGRIQVCGNCQGTGHGKNDCPRNKSSTLPIRGTKAPVISLLYDGSKSKAGNEQPQKRPSSSDPIYTPSGSPYLSDQSSLKGTNSQSSVITNYVRVSSKLSEVFQYGVFLAKIPPSQPNDHGPSREITQRSELKRVFEALRTQAPLKDRQDYFTDYKTLWSCRVLDTTLLSNVQYNKQSGKPMIIPSVEFKLQHTLRFSGEHDLIGQATTGDTQARDPAMLTQALNGMVTKHITERNDGLFEARPNEFYIQKIDTTLPKSLLIKRGYFTSIRPGADGVLLNVNIMHGTFIKPTLVSDFLEDDHIGIYGNVESLLKGRIVRIIYERSEDASVQPPVNRNHETNRKKVIAGLGGVPASQEFDDGKRKWTVKEWFKSQGLEIKKGNIPCVNVGLTVQAKFPKPGALWIPAEYLELEPFQVFGRQLSPEHMKTMISTAVKPPAVNQAAIVEEGLSCLGVGRQQNQVGFAAIGLTIGSTLLEIPATILSAPIIGYGGTPSGYKGNQTGAKGKGNATKSKEIVPINASWNLKDVKFFRPGTISGSSFGVLDLRSKPQAGRDAQSLGRGLSKRCSDHGLDLGIANVQFQPAKPLMSGPSRSPKAHYEAFKNDINTALERLGKPHSVLVLLDEHNAEHYSALKYAAECDLGNGFQTIVCTNGKIRKDDSDLQSLYSNLALKMNIKRGGQNHKVMSVKSPNSNVFAFTPLLGPSAAGGAPTLRMPGQSKNTPGPGELIANTLVLGVDVVHPGGNVPSIASMVGSVDKEFANFPGSIRLQPARVEILTRDNVRAMLKERVIAWKSKNTDRPLRRILYYRDGVSDQQYYDVLRDEVTTIQSEMAILQPGTAVRTTTIVVGKRHHTRFFAPRESMSYKTRFKDVAVNGNVRPGLLVNKTITLPASHPDNFEDFFLQSHAALDGTAKSAHYIVLQNACAFKMQDLYDVTHAFCYNYARATKGVSYCAPAYYADRLCDRAHKYLKAYLAANERNISGLPMNDKERQGGQQGILDFRARIARMVTIDPKWNKGRANPWHLNLNDTMFWL